MTCTRAGRWRTRLRAAPRLRVAVGVAVFAASFAAAATPQPCVRWLAAILPAAVAGGLAYLESAWGRARLTVLAAKIKALLRAPAEPPLASTVRDGGAPLLGLGAAGPLRPVTLRSAIRLAANGLLPALGAAEAALVVGAAALHLGRDAGGRLVLRRTDAAADAVIRGHWLAIVAPLGGATVGAISLPREGLSTAQVAAAAEDLNLRLAWRLLEPMPFGPEAGRRDRRWLGELGIRLLPLLLVSLAFLASQRPLAQTMLGTFSFGEFVQMVGLFVPLLSSAACLPVYVLLGEAGAALAPAALARRFLGLIPGLWAASCLATWLVSLGLRRSLDWSPELSDAFFAATSLYLLASLLMVYTYVARRLGLWLCGWLAYALALLVWPQAWALAPLGTVATLGAALLVLALRAPPRRAARRSVARPAAATRPRPPAVPTALVAMGKGLLLGTVFWGDKVLLFLKAPNALHDGVVYLALLPASAVFTYYYAKLAPRISTLFSRVVYALYAERLPLYLLLREGGAQVLASGLRELFWFGGAVSLLALPVLASLYSFEARRLSLALGASWALAFEAIAINTLLYLNRQRQAYGVCAAHLGFLVWIARGAATPNGLNARTGAFAIVATCVLVQRLAREGRSPEFGIFWRRQVRW